MAQHQQTVRPDPRFTINALTRYMGATASQRTRIIRDQKYPPTYKVIWYEAACGVISRFIAGGMQDDTVLTGEINRLNEAESANEQEAQKIALNIEAIESFLDSYDQIQLGDMNPTLGANSAPYLMLGGVSVSVRPDVEFRGVHRDKDVAGAIKLYFSKNESLTTESAQFGAAVLMLHCQTQVDGQVTARPQLCSMFDVFTGVHYQARPAMSQRVQNLEHACREITIRWPGI